MGFQTRHWVPGQRAVVSQAGPRTPGPAVASPSLRLGSCDQLLTLPTGSKRIDRSRGSDGCHTSSGDEPSYKGLAAAPRRAKIFPGQSTVVPLRPALLWLLAALSLAGGCTLLLPQPYGAAAPDSDSVRADGGPVSMPANAPSILNGHWTVDGGHQGIDILGPVGTPVLAPASGKVAASWFGPMYGHQILIDHGIDSDGMHLRTRLVHLSRRGVKAGDPVARGQRIGDLGRTGLLAGGLPHLHYEIQRADRPVSHRYRSYSPHRFWIDGAGVVTCFDHRRSYPEQPFRTTYPVPCSGIPWE